MIGQSYTVSKLVIEGIEKNITELKERTNSYAIEITSSRNFLNTDIGKVLIITNSNVVLTMPTEIDATFNCCVKPLQGYDCTINFGTLKHSAPNGLIVEENNMISISRSLTSFFVSP